MLRLGIAALALLLLPSSAAAADWSEPTQLQRFKSPISVDPQVGIDAAGRATVLWTKTHLGFKRPPGITPPPGEHFPPEGSKGVVFVTDIGAGGRVGPARRLSPKGRIVHSARLAVAPDGSAAVLWTRGPLRGQRGGRPRRIELLTRAPGGDWSRPRVLETEGRNYAGDVVIEPDGTIAAAWTALRAGGGDLHLRRYAPDGTVVSAEQMGRGTAPQLAASPAFPRAVATFLRGTSRVTRDTYLFADGRETLVGDGTYWRPQIAAGDRIALAWSQSRGGNDDAAMVTQVGTEGAAEKLRLSPTTVAALEPAVAAHGDRMVASWYYSRSVPGADTEYDVRVYLGPDRPAEDPTAAADLHGMASSVAVGADRAVAVFSQATAADNRMQPATLAAAVARGDGPLRPAQIISAPDDAIRGTSRPPLAMNAAGAAVVAYTAGTGTDSRKPHVSVVTLPAR